MWKKLGNFLYILLSLLIVSCSNVQQNNIKIQKVYDGDTFIDTNNLRYRLFGIDTPEIKDKNGNLTKGMIQSYAKQAKNFTINFIKKSPDLKINFIQEDAYKRKVVKVFGNNFDLAKELVKNGLAIVRYISLDQKSPFYTLDINYYGELLNLELEARKNKQGFWSLNKNYQEIMEDIFDI